MNKLAIDTHNTIQTITEILANDHDQEQGVKTVLKRLAQQDYRAETGTSPNAERIPGCNLFPEILQGVSTRYPVLAQQISAIEGLLKWQRNPNYSAKILGQHYYNNYGFAEIIGPDGVFAGTDFRLALFVLGPGLTYPEHSHKAPELYWTLTGPHAWKHHGNDEWQSYPANSCIWHQSGEVHATKCLDQAFFAIVFWTQDVLLLPKLLNKESR